MSRSRVLSLFALAASVSGMAWAADAPRGGRFGWARLITPGGQSGVHRDRDPTLASFIGKNTSLNIEANWSTADPRNLEQLCTYPFIYAKELATIFDRRDLQNLREYLQRGGFFCVDPCTTTNTNVCSLAEQDAFIRRQEEWFSQLLPEVTTREFPDDHEIYRCYFKVVLEDLFPPDYVRRGGTKPPRIGMHGVFLGDRLIAVISVSGLECGWPQSADRGEPRMKMIANLYIYAMTRHGAPRPP